MKMGINKITQFNLAQHYRDYAAKSDEFVANMAMNKKFIVDYALAKSGFVVDLSKDYSVAVLGASDKRYLGIHDKIFKEFLGDSTEIETLDLNTSHLLYDDPEKNTHKLVEFDVTNSFQSSYDLIFDHELMKFLTPEEQVQVLLNKYDALNEGGIALTFIHDPSIYATPEFEDWQYRVDPKNLEAQLKEKGVNVTRFKYGFNNTPGRENTEFIILDKRV